MPTISPAHDSQGKPISPAHDSAGRPVEPAHVTTAPLAAGEGKERLGGDPPEPSQTPRQAD